MLAFEIIIKGRVQGVGYRYFVKTNADMLGIKGWVRNTREGKVEIHAEGDKNAIETLIDYCRQGPARAIVKDIVVNEDRLMNFDNFEIRF